MENTDIEFSVVSSSNGELLFGCLQSLERAMEKTRYTWLVRVTTEEPSSEFARRIEQRHPRASLLDRPSTNHGGDHSAVLSAARARYVWLLTDEIYFFPDSVEPIIRFLDLPENARVGVAAPALVRADGTPKPAGYSFPSKSAVLAGYVGFDPGNLKSSPQPPAGSVSGNGAAVTHHGAAEVETVPAVCAVVRMKAVRQVGPMSKSLPHTAAEDLWFSGFRDRHWKLVYHPGTAVIHYGTLPERVGPNPRDAEALRASLHFFRQNESGSAYAAFCVALLALCAAKAAACWMGRDRIGAAASWRNARIVLSELSFGPRG